MAVNERRSTMPGRVRSRSVRKPRLGLGGPIALEGPAAHVRKVAVIDEECRDVAHVMIDTLASSATTTRSLLSEFQRRP